MKRVVTIGLTAGAMAISGCQGSTQGSETLTQAEVTPAEPEGEAEEPIPEPEALLIGSGLRIKEERALRLYDDHCGPDTPYLAKYLTNFEGTKVVIYDARQEIVATTEIIGDHSGDGCYWEFSAEVPAESDFYFATFSDFSTAVVPAADAVDGRLELDMVGPISEQVDIDKREMLLKSFED